MPTYSEIVSRYLNRQTGRFLALEDGIEDRIRNILRMATAEIDSLVATHAGDEDTYIARLRALRNGMTRLFREVSDAEAIAIQNGLQQVAVFGVEQSAEAARRAAEQLGISIDATPDTIQISQDVLRVMAEFPLGGAPLSDRLWQTNNQTMGAVMRTIQQGVLLGRPTERTARLIRDSLIDPTGSAREKGTIAALRTRARNARVAGETERANRLFARARVRERQLPDTGKGIYRSAHANAMREVRSETVRTYQEAAFRYGQRKGWVVGYYWYPNPEACPICVALEGYYKKGAAPSFPHAHCGCRIEQVADPEITGQPDPVWRDVPAGVTGLAAREYWTNRARNAA